MGCSPWCCKEPDTTGVTDTFFTFTFCLGGLEKLIYVSDFQIRK